MSGERRGPYPPVDSAIFAGEKRDDGVQEQEKTVEHFEWSAVDGEMRARVDVTSVPYTTEGGVETRRATQILIHAGEKSVDLLSAAEIPEDLPLVLGGDRVHYESDTGEVFLAPFDSNGDFFTSLHEIGHALQHRDELMGRLVQIRKDVFSGSLLESYPSALEWVDRIDQEIPFDDDTRGQLLALSQEYIERKQQGEIDEIYAELLRTREARVDKIKQILLSEVPEYWDAIENLEWDLPDEIYDDYERFYRAAHDILSADGRWEAIEPIVTQQMEHEHTNYEKSLSRQKTVQYLYDEFDRISAPYEEWMRAAGPETYLAILEVDATDRAFRIADTVSEELGTSLDFPSVLHKETAKEMLDTARGVEPFSEDGETDFCAQGFEELERLVDSKDGVMPSDLLNAFLRSYGVHDPQVVPFFPSELEARIPRQPVA